ncbi:hydroxyacylglutathione hydrolase family protein [Desulfatirhabdium butyrativorans]|uniref:hydroxyacylglutathione hydrolase family protein n=1 Tax=Desulfatirhabdium butyrativorans TaxID=340467 RepID=UPI0003F7019E|nr:hydroxyacylglutathione hydrolase family protein [Desulfatirhabdium butyrativorans]
MHIRQFRYGSDNLAYVVHDETEALAIDPGASRAIADHIADRGLKLRAIAHTHEHPDHTCGTADLLRLIPAPVIPSEELLREPVLRIGAIDIRVLATPGHTTDSRCFHLPGHILTGDTLFNGTVGNCFSGDIEAFYRSVLRLMSLDGGTIVLAGHDYVTYSMAFARIVEPDNPHIEGYLKRYDPGFVRSTLSEELQVNPYLRFNAPEMIAVLKQKGLPVDTEFERWTAVMNLG